VFGGTKLPTSWLPGNRKKEESRDRIHPSNHNSSVPPLPTRLHLLKFLSSPNSTTSWRPSL
jgi:hypothetical protein